MASIDDALPTADPAARLTTTGRTSDGRSRRIVVDRDHVRVGMRALPLDDLLRATLAWTATGDALLLELRSVPSPTERDRVRLLAPRVGLPAWREVSLNTLEADGDAVRCTATELRRVLARVRAVLEANPDPTAQHWQPPGNLAVFGSHEPPPFTPVTAADVASQPLVKVVATGPNGSTLALEGRVRSGGGPDNLSLTLGALAVLISLVAIGFFGATGALWGSVLLGGSLLAVAGMLGGTQLDLGRRHEVVVTPTAVRALGNRVVARPRELWLPVDDPAAHHLRVVDETGVVQTIDLLVGSAAFWQRVLLRAWQVRADPPSDEVAPLPRWVHAALDPAPDARDQNLRFAADALWLDGVGVAPRGVFVPRLGEWLDGPVEMHDDASLTIGERRIDGVDAPALVRLIDRVRATRRVGGS